MADSTPGRRPRRRGTSSQGQAKNPALTLLGRSRSISSTGHNLLPQSHRVSASWTPGPSTSRSASTSSAAGPSRSNGRAPVASLSSVLETTHLKDSDGDVEMVDAVPPSVDHPAIVEAPPVAVAPATTTTAAPPTGPVPRANRLLDEHGDVFGRIPNWFRLLDLIDEHGSGGIVEKVVIDQPSLQRFLNLIQPGSYDSVSKINIKDLDNLSIKPTGLYGSRSEIIKFLEEVGCLDTDSVALLSQLSLDSSEDSPPVLRSGLYLALHNDHETRSPTKCAYIVYWPEDTTWDDQTASSSVRRNRVTFMRYLTKLADQTIALISTSQAQKFVWEAGAHNKDLPEDQQEGDERDRLYSFEVTRSLEQEEDATASPGFAIVVEAKHLPKSGTKMRVDLVPGEQKAALLVSTSEDAQEKRVAVNDQPISQMALRNMIQSASEPLQLGNLSPESLELLAVNGLQDKFKSLFSSYEKKIRAAERARSKSEEEDKRFIDHQIHSDELKVQAEVQNIIRATFNSVFPSLNVGLDMANSPEESALLHNRYAGLRQEAETVRQIHNWAIVGDNTFRDLKRKWFIIQDCLEVNSGLSPHDQHIIIDSALRGITPAPVAQPRWGWRSLNPFSGGSPSPATPQPNRDFNQASNLPSDHDFVEQLHPLRHKYPSLHDLMSRIYDCLWRELAGIESNLLQVRTNNILSNERQGQYRAASNTRELAFLGMRQKAFTSLMGELRKAMSSNSRRTICVDSVRQLQHASLRWSGTRTSSVPAHKQYKIHPLELTEQDIQSCRADEAHVPQPKLESKHNFEFATVKERSVQFLHLVRDKCLVVISEPGHTRIYVEDKVSLDHSINTTNGKVALNHDSLGGPRCMFALDQATRLFAIMHGERDIKLSIFIFDELFSNLRSRGSPIPIHRWYDQPVELARVCFVPGAEALCLVEKSGRVRIFSLVTQQFRNTHLQIAHPIVNAFPAPDGSCLLVAIRSGQRPSTPERLLAFHWASFGPNSRGIDSTELPASDTYRVATRFEGRGRIHVISFDTRSRMIRSTVLQVKQKATEFSFRSDLGQAQNKAAETLNNSLLDCHLEVWTRFPVVPAVSRNTLSPIHRHSRKLTCLSPVILGNVKDYFETMIMTFEQTTRKPMGGTLSAIVVRAADKLQTNEQDEVSEFQLGSFIVELLCMIPLHLAITRENRFIPLKDGVWNPEYERTLLGADVPAIVDALSLGWYESLFQSYMSTKPVRVVSSMGEQSVGKSYCLNHFADTSFAGSAMRTTEGVWLSCTPTEDYLLVSLDFEGVHSIERSAQEDALLVLFNTAISNLVLFRNNFAISRDIAGLFTSFQSSAMVLDPSTNLGLFNSMLAIIIKDVTDSDSRDIVREFSLRFQQIVEREQDQNFISRLHRGRIQIIPWPVINSPKFYSLFLLLRQQLDKQKFTHGNGGRFLHNLKTLMAKIKANDWGSLDQNLATHRAQQLAERLTIALSRGQFDEGPLKNLDTDEAIISVDNSLNFFVPDLVGSHPDETEPLIEKALQTLIQACGSTLRFQPSTTDAQYVEVIQKDIYDAVDQRLALVKQWFAVNVERFPAGNQDIRNVTDKLNSAMLAMRASVRICSSGCAGCLLLCLRSRGHAGEHSCGTNHRCVSDCEVSEGHVHREPCGLPAGHEGKHMCNVKTHSCGDDCHLSKMAGCAKSCIKPLFHKGEHICSTRAHICGQPCDLRNARNGQHNGGYSCPGTCNLPWDQPHKRHVCENSRDCPMQCFLCRRLCCEPNHFHGLDPNSVHLCGQEHNCTKLCDAAGLCNVEVRPSAIEEQFAGKHESFTYTRYTQVSQRLSCVIPIQPGKLSHEGPHTHDTSDTSFHFCDARCPDCRYICTYPFGHSQQLHKTSHGSMIATQWVLEHDDGNTSYELDGRKYGSGDEGGPMLCSLVCLKRGRHAHIDYCRSEDPDNCEDPDCEHIPTRMHPDPDKPKDWITHAAYWARNGFEDPYSQDKQDEFARCDFLCADPGHATTVASPETPSYCTLPMFHAPMPSYPAPLTGYVSRDGHSFDCQNPSRLNQSYHVVFVIDSSGSMTDDDRVPLPNTPISTLLVSKCNNRYGAVLSALYGFWRSRETSTSVGSQTRRDAYSVITFDDEVQTRLQNDFSSTTEELINGLIPQLGCGGTDFQQALAQAQSVIEDHWSDERAPVLIFLSDGECYIDDDPVYDLCQLCVRLGKPLAFYSVSFGTDTYSRSLRRMTEIAYEVYARAPQDVLTASRGNPCAYANVVDSIQLADKFLGIANSLQKSRASLINQSGRHATF